MLLVRLVVIRKCLKFVANGIYNSIYILQMVNEQVDNKITAAKTKQKQKKNENWAINTVKIPLFDYTLL